MTPAQRRGPARVVGSGRPGGAADGSLPFVVERGQGPPVLLVHGQPGLGRDWAAVAERLPDHRLLIPDRPGYGRSGGTAVSMEENAAALAAVLHERRAVPATVVGHSYGGGVAILLAARHPEVVSGLVLVGSVGRADALTPVDRLLAAPVVGEAVSAVGLFTLGRVLPIVRAAVGEHPGRTLDWIRAALPDATYRTVSSAAGRRVWRSFVAEQRDLLREIGAVEEALGSVRAPTVVVSGAWDVVVTPSVSASVAAAIDGSQLVSVARAAHFVPRDAPGTVAEAVRSVEDRWRRGLGRLDQDAGA